MFVDKHNQVKSDKAISNFDLINARWVSPLSRQEAEEEVHQQVLTSIVENFAKANEEFAIRQARRALHQRSLGLGHFEIDPFMPFISVDQVLTALPQLDKVSASALSHIEFFGVPEAIAKSEGEPATPTVYIKKEE